MYFNSISVRDFTRLFTENVQEISIFDLESGMTVWTGYIYDLPEKYEDYEIDSLDVLFEATKCITINITIPVD